MNYLRKDKMCLALNMVSLQVCNIISIGMASHECPVPYSAICFMKYLRYRDCRIASDEIEFGIS